MKRFWTMVGAALLLGGAAGAQNEAGDEAPGPSLMIDMIERHDAGDLGPRNVQEMLKRTRPAVFPVRTAGTPAGIAFMIDPSGIAAAPREALAGGGTIGAYLRAFALPAAARQELPDLNLTFIQVRMPDGGTAFHALELAERRTSIGDTLYIIEPVSPENTGLRQAVVRAAGDAQLLPADAPGSEAYGSDARWLAVETDGQPLRAGCPLVDHRGHVMAVATAITDEATGRCFVLDAGPLRGALANLANDPQVVGNEVPPPLHEAGLSDAGAEMNPQETRVLAAPMLETPTLAVEQTLNPALLRREALKFKNAPKGSIAMTARLVDEVVQALAKTDGNDRGFSIAIDFVRTVLSEVPSKVGDSFGDETQAKVVARLAEGVEPGEPMWASGLVLDRERFGLGDHEGTLVRLDRRMVLIAGPRIETPALSLDEVFVGGLFAGTIPHPAGDVAVLRHGFVVPLSK